MFFTHAACFVICCIVLIQRAALCCIVLTHTAWCVLLHSSNSYMVSAKCAELERCNRANSYMVHIWIYIYSDPSSITRVVPVQLHSLSSTAISMRIVLPRNHWNIQLETTISIIIIIIIIITADSLLLKLVQNSVKIVLTTLNKGPLF